MLATSEYKQKKNRSKQNAKKLKLNEVIELVKMLVDIEQAADRYLGISLAVMKGSRRTKHILCPYHSEKTGSMAFDLQKNQFKCFGCGLSGDVINLVALQEKVSLARAAYIIAEDFGLVVAGVAKQSAETKKKIDESLKLKEAKEWYRKDFDAAFIALVDLTSNIERDKIQKITNTVTLDQYGDWYHTKVYYDSILDGMTAADEKEKLEAYKLCKEVLALWQKP